MKYILLLFLACISSLRADPKKSIHSNFPATKWEDAMLTGNGMTGAMIYGGQPEETIIYTNHKLLLPGNGRDSIPNMADMLAPMREKMLAGDIGGGWKLYWDEWQKRSGGGMFWTQQFHPGFQLNINFFDGSYPIKYKRSTRYQTGEVLSEFTDGNGQWIRETFASRAQDIVVTRLRSSNKGKLVSAHFKLAACENHNKNVGKEATASHNWLRWRSKYATRKGEQGGHEGLVRLVIKGKNHRQRVSKNKDTLSVTGAEEILLITGIDRYRADFSEWDKDELKKRLEAVDPNYDSLLSEHVAIHQPIYDRVDYDLGASEEDRSLSTEQLIANEISDKDSINLALLEKLFYTSRYLFMASSGDDYAPRLSGLFIGKWGAAWAGDYTMDANANMAVFGGHIGNMPEMMKGYQSIIERTLPQWRAGAKQLYGMRGILGPVRIDGEVAVPHHINHYHAHCTATGLGPWILYPLWENYLVTGDKEFLKNTLYPIFEEQMLFYEDFLTIKDNNGKVVFIPSNSPENAWSGVQPRTSASINSTMDISACRQFLTIFLQAQKDLGLPESEKAQQLLTDLPPYLVNTDGALQEWSWPGHGENYGHRHSSHMYTVWPGYDINPENLHTKDLVSSVSKALKKRDHRIIQAHDFIQRAIGWLRVKNGEEFYKILKYTLENNYHFTSLATSHDLNHRIYNFDYILSLQGMLIENAIFTNPGILELLPAMPAALSKGELSGIKGRNRCTIHSLKWDMKKHSIICSITSDIDQDLTLIHRSGFSKISGIQSKTSPHGEHARIITLEAGKRIDFTISF